MRTRRRQGSAMLGPGPCRLAQRTGGLELSRSRAAFPGSRARDPADGRRYAACHHRLLPTKREAGLNPSDLEECVDRGIATAGDVFGVFLPVARIEGLKAPWSGVLPGLKACEQGPELDHAFPRQDAVGVFDLPWRFVGCVIQMDQCEPVERERGEWPAAAGVPVTGVENEVDALDAVDRLVRDLGRVDRAVAKAEELEGDPDAQPVSPVAGQLERVARPRNGPSRFEPG